MSISVHVATDCAVAVGTSAWPFVDRHRAEIDRHWSRRQAENPSFFDGQVYMLDGWDLAGRLFSANAVAVPFRAYLYWRENGRPDPGMRHVFGGAAIEAGGGLLVVRAAAGTINDRNYHLPGGFIDDGDRVSHGAGDRIDVAGQVWREVAEELGLGPDDLAPAGGYIITEGEGEFGLIRRLQARTGGDELLRRVEAHLGTAGDGEVADIRIVRRLADLPASETVAYCAAVASALLEAGGDGAFG